MSGVESTLMVLIAQMPPTIMASTNMHTAGLWVTEKWMIFLIII